MEILIHLDEKEYPVTPIMIAGALVRHDIFSGIDDIAELAEYLSIYAKYGKLAETSVDI